VVVAVAVVFWSIYRNVCHIETGGLQHKEGGEVEMVMMWSAQHRHGYSGASVFHIYVCIDESIYTYVFTYESNRNTHCERTGTAPTWCRYNNNTTIQRMGQRRRRMILVVYIYIYCLYIYIYIYMLNYSPWSSREGYSNTNVLV
jgi:hypothetical protein